MKTNQDLIDWIAYNLMDSVVDTFFPLIDFIEQESNEVDNFLANPFGDEVAVTGPVDPDSNSVRKDDESVRKGNVTPQRVSGDSASGTAKVSESYASFEMVELPVLKSSAGAEIKPWRTTLPFSIPDLIQKRLPIWWRFPSNVEDSSTLVGSHTVAMPVPSTKKSSSWIGGLSLAQQSLGPGTTSGANIVRAVDKSLMLKKIAETRKLITGLSRMLMPKTEVVNGLRKRTHDVGLLGTARNGDSLLDIQNYLGDLSGEPQRISCSLADEIMPNLCSTFSQIISLLCSKPSLSLIIR